VEKKSISPIDGLWKVFTSVKLAVVLIFLIAFTSVIGTVVEQDVEPEKNIKFFAGVFGDAAAPAVFKFSRAAGFLDMYHSWWFLTLLLLFAANLTICSVERLPKIHRAVSEPLKPLPPDVFGRHSIKKEILMDGKFDEVKARVEKLIGKLGINCAEHVEDGVVQFYGQKGRYSRYAVYVVHLSIIITLLGAVVGAFFGFNGFVSIQEGKASDAAYTRQGGEHPLGFAVKCEDFSVQFYGESDMPKAYTSWLTVIDDGKEVIKNRPIEVNDPLRYKGYTFYQSSYGPAPDAGDGANGLLFFKITPKGAGQSEIIKIHTGESFKIPGTGIVGKTVYFSPALGFREDGSPFTYTDMMNNPAVYVEYEENGRKKFGRWMAKRHPESWTLPEGHTVEFMDNWGYQATGLQVRKDPGVGIVYLGCILMTIGLYAAFFTSHRKLWIMVVSEKKGRVRVSIAASASKHKVSFETDIDGALKTV
jgi:cytochrome c biogenesis protein